MALINCPNCGCKVSDKADACPKCGTPISDSSESLEKEIVPPAISVDNQSEENEEQKFYKSILHLIELENYEDAFVGIDTLLAQSDHPDQYVGLKESVVEKWVKKLTEDADRYISNDMAEDANGCIQQALMLKPNDVALLSRLDTVNALSKKKSPILIIGLSLMAVAVAGVLIWFFLTRQNNGSQENIAEEKAETSSTVLEETTSQNQLQKSDLNLFEVKGKVKSISFIFEGEEYNWPEYCLVLDNTEVIFNEKGEWVNKPDDVSYDENGLIKEINGYFVGFNDSNNISSFGGNAGETDFYYDENKELSSVTIVSKSFAGVDTSSSMIEVVEYDSHGNWIARRSGNGAIERRSITYFGENALQKSNVKNVVINGVNLRLRLGPSTEHDCLIDESTGQNAHPEKGESFPYLGEADGFFKINYKGHEVYVSKDYAYIEGE